MRINYIGTIYDFTTLTRRKQIITHAKLYDNYIACKVYTKNSVRTAIDIITIPPEVPWEESLKEWVENYGTNCDKPIRFNSEWFSVEEFIYMYKLLVGE